MLDCLGLFRIQSYVGYWAGRGHAKCLAVGMSPGDDDAFLLSVP